MTIPGWTAVFPDLAAITDECWLREASAARVMNVPPGAVLFRDGDDCSSYVMVVEGAIRVQKIDPQGREILLYRVEEGQTCMLTTTCLIGTQAYPAEGVAETAVRLVALTYPSFHRALIGSEAFRSFVFRSIGQRISDLMLLIEDVAFGRMDARLSRVLLKRFQEKGETLVCTHQELATELGTAREVVSRLLKDFEHKGWVSLGRGRIRILAAGSLGEVADQDV
ncbi:MAG: Crp/Fnr family transcriptional regulator [Mariprofundaceae bacterium]|nr:Crp/Fnr family transcriptional regulator [Mariprofundaceae bacterium]